MNARFDTLVRGGEIITVGGRSRAEIGISEGRIVAIGESLGTAADEIDASGLLVLPGGIDSHCHVDQISSAGVRTADDFATASVSAAHGGITTIIPFAAQKRGETLRATIDAYHRLADGRASIDYAFHTIVTDAGDAVLAEMPALVEEGYTSFKVYMTYEALRLSDRSILDVLDTARRLDSTVMMHAESHELLTWLTDRLVAEGRTAPRFHADARPRAIEREAVHRAMTMAEIAGGRVLLVHMSGKEAVEQLAWGKAFGIPVLAETCPQYLVLTRENLDLPGFEGAKYCCSPPLRDAESQAALWHGLAAGTIDIVSSDHSAYRFGGSDGKRVGGEDTPFHRIPMGLPMLETSLPILFSEGVARGRITLERFVALSATNAAKIYGLYPRKGTIAVGSDADLVFWDPRRRWTVQQTEMHGAADYCPVEGMVLTGRPVRSISRGRSLCVDGIFSGPKGAGVFLPAAAGAVC